MKKQNVEKVLKKSAKKIKLKKFSVVWQQIEGVVDSSQQRDKKKFPPWAKVVSVCVACCIVALLVVTPILVAQYKENNRVYAFSELGREEVEQDEFYLLMEKAGIEIIDATAFANQKYTIYTTPKGKVLGGEVYFLNKAKFPDFYLNICAFSKKVLLEQGEYIYSNTLTVDGIEFDSTDKIWGVELSTTIYYAKAEMQEQNMALKLGIYAYVGSMEDDISPYDEIEEILEYLF